MNYSATEKIAAHLVMQNTLIKVEKIIKIQ